MQKISGWYVTSKIILKSADERFSGYLAWQQNQDNYEIDFGVEQNYENLSIKAKVFHSWMKDYIHYNSNNTTKLGTKNIPYHAQENVDAKIYGFDISGVYSFTDDIYLDFGMAYQRGKKDNALDGQTDKDLANITPAKLNLALNYDYMANGTVKVEVIAADAWDDYDSDNGEQQLSGYGVMNLQARQDLTRNFEVTLGVDNVFDKTYAVSNTYDDLILLGDASGDVMLMNEPGRYYYINAALKF